jgi:hypothetical protein
MMDNFPRSFDGFQQQCDTLEKWLSLLEGYFSVQNFSNSEKITFTLLKDLPHVRYWWETYCEKHVGDESAIFGPEPTWVDFVDALKEKYYPVGNYDDQYMRWTTLFRRETRRCARVHQHIPYLVHKAWVLKTLSDTWS